MGKRSLVLLGAALSVLVFAATAFAIPSLQVYIPGSTAEDNAPDADTWWASVLPGTFDAYVVGAFGPNDNTISNGFLLVTVPQSETAGSFSVAGHAVSPRYDTVGAIPLPSGLNGLAHHYPVGDSDAFDYYTVGIGNFTRVTTGLYNYNAGDGTITYDANAEGEVKTLSVTASDFTLMHFDAYAQINGEKWDSNAFSHDSTATEGGSAVPEPATLSLLGLGLVGALAYSKFRK